MRVKNKSILESVTKYTYGINAGDLFKEQTDSDGNIIYQAWFFKGEKHRLDGPAVKRIYGKDEYWVNGLYLSKEEFPQHPLVMNHNRLEKRKETIQRVLDN